jgi:hypothetical protein
MERLAALLAVSPPTKEKPMQPHLCSSVKSVKSVIFHLYLLALTRACLTGTERKGK